MNLSEIIPYWRNPRKNENAVDAVVKSIERFGYNSPIVVDNENVIIIGHTRYKALKILNYKKAQVVILDIDPKLAKEYRIIDNKTQELAKWDMENLIPELREFDGLGEFEIFFPEFKFDSLEIGESNLNLVSQDDIDDSEKKDKDNIESSNTNTLSDYVDVICPECGKGYKLSRYQILTNQN